MKYSHRTWIVVSGFIWTVIGLFLLRKGLAYIIGFPASLKETSPLLTYILNWTGTIHQTQLFVTCLALFVGFIKGRFVLAKTARKIIDKILSQPSPVCWRDVYSKKYFILIVSMMLLGVVFKWLPINVVFKGFIDIAIGSALINGALLYFKAAFTCHRTT